jgi:tRNA modification GTPase
VLELHAHGGQMIMDILLARVLELGARLAKPGEFTERAYLNKKIDLVQAEAIADLINASSHEAALAASRSLQGDFSSEVNKIMVMLTNLRAKVEATIDFVEEEEISSLTNNSTAYEIDDLLKNIKNLIENAKVGVVLQEGVTLVITGATNVGKSSLFNYLNGRDAAIVTAVPGTTRDVLRASINLDGIPINLLDTAGLRESTDEIEEEGIRRAKEEIARSQHILLMAEAQNRERPEQLIAKFLGKNHEPMHLTLLYNKIDLTNEDAKITKENNFDCVYLSLKEKKGLDLLKKHLKEKTATGNVETVFSARKRHLEALNEALENLQAAQNKISYGPEMVAEDLKKAQECLGEMLGKVTSEEILNKIFSDFCIGK